MALDVHQSPPVKLSSVLSDTNLKQPLIPYRYLVIFLIFLVSAVAYCARCVINFAILAMVSEEALIESENSSIVRKEIQIKFNWNQHEQGLILGAYFYTYAPGQIIAGILTDKFNAVHLMTISLIVSGLCSFLSPIAAQFGLVYLILLRSIMGFFHGVVFPAFYVIIERWLNPTEIAFAQGVSLVGSNIGNVIVMPLTAWICDNRGWQLSFYVMGVASILVAIFWAITLTNDPSKNRWITKAEKDYLLHLNSSRNAKIKITKTPWLSMLTSIPLWSVMIARGLACLVYYEINSKVPVYMERVLGYKLQNNGLTNSLFYVSMSLSQLVVGPVAKWLIIKGWLSKTVTRKIFETLALTVSGICLLIIPYLDGRSNVIIIVIIVEMFFLGFTTAGDTPIIPEMAPHLVGTAYGISNILACFAGFIAPTMTASILGDEVTSQSKWNLTFYAFAGSQFVGAILFLLFATAKPQPWGTAETWEKAITSIDPETHDSTSKL